MRWLMPMPVLPAIQAGSQPPLGVTEIAQPFSSAAWIEVVPARKSGVQLRASLIGLWRFLFLRRVGPVLQDLNKWIQLLALKWIRIARSNVRIVFRWVD
jgi:hypothetical protein